MTEKIFGLEECKVQELVDKYNCVILRKDFVPVVSVEELEKICKELILEDATWAVEKAYVGGIEAVLKIVRKRSGVLK